MELYDNNMLVSADKLADFGILSIKPDHKTLQSSDIKRYFDRIDLVKDNDYDLRRQLASQSKGSRGAKYKDIYMLTCDGFKKALMMSSNNKYKDYYLLLEKCIRHYDKQQRMIKNAIISEKTAEVKEKKTIIIQKDDKIDELKAMIEAIKEQNNKTAQMLEEQNTKINEQSSKIDEQTVILNKICTKLDSCAHIPSDDNLSERFVVMKKK